MYKSTILTLLLSTTIFANEVPQNIIDTGDKVSKSLVKHLGSKLKHELQTNGLLSAALFCNENAYILTEEINLHQVKGVSVKRISLKYRNPANIPNQEEVKVLENMQVQLDAHKLSPYLVTKTDSGYKYYKPLVIKNGVCLKCHGNISKNKELSTFMQEHYPKDKAIDYKMNDLRGAILVEIKN